MGKIHCERFLLLITAAPKWSMCKSNWDERSHKNTPTQKKWVNRIEELENTRETAKKPLFLKVLKY